MEVRCAPDGSEALEGSGPIRRFLKDLSKEKPPELFALVMATISLIDRSENMEALKASGYSERLPRTREPIHVLKIPPKHRSAGVARIYYGYVEGKPQTIMLLTGEKKHQRHKDDLDKINAAEEFYRQLCKAKKGTR